MGKYFSVSPWKEFNAEQVAVLTGGLCSESAEEILLLRPSPHLLPLGVTVTGCRCIT